ncbi:unnamed protein product [Candida verbasci]|uniref:L-type lectin-like domain-containing protein n=1 Tax=Candida verbasci TaxID=1227364 RepID=A0A9W4TVS7_9ASCO|nr:unnamed protein product [Candida verbasci]
MSSSLIFTIQRSRPLQGLLAIFIFIILYFTFFTSLFSSSSSTYSPEEINSILQNKQKSLLSLDKVELKQQELKVPFLDDSNFNIKNWYTNGNTFVRNDQYIRLTSNSQHLASNIFSKAPIQAESFEMELTFHIHNEQRRLVGDGLAIWFLNSPSNIGDVFGVENYFNGLGIMIDTYKNGKRGSFPYVNLMLGDGKTRYDKGTDGYDTRLAGCSAKDVLNPPSKQTKMRLVYIKDGYLSIDFNYRGKHEDWENCVTLTDVKLPSIKYLGLSAETGQLFENVDIIENKIFALYKPDGQFVESINELDELIKLQNEVESETANMADIAKQQQQKLKQGGRNRAFKKKLSSEKRKSLKRLKNAEKRIKEQEQHFKKY